MCGIAGIVALRDGPPPASREALARMAGSLRHRGPDEFGIYRDGRAGLAHARLSIIDLSTGQQPLSNEDGTIWIVYNGEIFNYVELREELAARGHRFRTKSDTEVIVHSFEEWGEDAFARFNGQFALALWDAPRATLTLARDRVGVRPLYVSQQDGRLVFASEVKAIFAGDPRIPRRLDPAGLDDTFTFWSVLAPRSVFEGIEELPPGCLRVHGPGVFKERRYWSSSYPAGRDGEFRGSLGDAVDAVRGALEEATRLRMLRADVPVGSYLSGGLDSSLVAAMGLAAKGERFKTFSLRFADAEYDETGYQRLMVERLGSEHAEIVVTRKDIADEFPRVIHHAERPILRTAPAPLFMLSRLVRQGGIKVVLTGEGADEFFAGYDLFREAKGRRFWARAPGSTLRPRLLERLYPYLLRSPVAQQAIARQFFGRQLERWQAPGFGHDLRWQSAAALKRMFAPALRRALAGRDAVGDQIAALPPEFQNWTHLAQDQYIEIVTLLSAYLLSSQGDRMLMAHSVEGRFPFLDSNVIDLADSLPPRYKLPVLDEKHILKRVGVDLLPREILERKKQPYRAPDALSFAGADAPAWVAEMMAPEAIAAAGVFDPVAASRLWRKCQTFRDEQQFSQADNMALVGILSTQLLHSQFIAAAPAAEPPAEIRTVVDRLSPA